MVEDDGRSIVGDGEVVDTVGDVGVPVFFKVIERDGVNRNELVGRGVKNRECGGVREIGVLDVFQEIGDDKFLNGVLDINTIGDGVGDEGTVSIIGGGRDGTEDEDGERRAGEGVGKSGNVEIGHNVVGKVSKLKLVDGKGHVRYSGEAGEV